jgi:hypothetical protein
LDRWHSSAPGSAVIAEGRWVQDREYGLRDGVRGRKPEGTHWLGHYGLLLKLETTEYAKYADEEFGYKKAQRAQRFLTAKELPPFMADTARAGQVPRLWYKCLAASKLKNLE